MGSVADMDPALSRLEWQAVSAALTEASVSGCRAIGTPGVARRLFRKLTGDDGRRPPGDPKIEAVRSFVCETNRQRRIAEHHVPALLDHGFNYRQVDALALLSA